jgi:hypothetical protein
MLYSRLVVTSSVRRIVLCAVALAAAVCATIHPWERERLSRPDMELSSSPELMQAEGHATEVREGAIGGLGGSGGGCGCN